ncbi:MAG: MATE family efflux transporter [Pseudoflavonifractor sp.]|nr:MATE family efflux transporter [Alloprevotella sp.]MCM1116888.1 MATE family efflux transporter [Pseudoflavonifractor sp.]
MSNRQLTDNSQASSRDSRLKELATGSIGRLLWRYSLPAVVGMVVMSLYNVIDRIFIGQGVGPEAIAGLAITFPVMNVATALGVLIGAGSSARVSILLGSGNHEGASRVLGNASSLTLIIGVIYVTLFAIFLDPMLRLFGASDITLPYARDFIFHLLPGLLLTNIAFSLNNVIRASGYPVRAMATMLIGAGSNLLLAPVFIFWLGWGITGAAVATDIAMAISAIFVLSHFFSKKVDLRFRRGIFSLRAKTVAGIVSIGAAPCLVNFAGSAINVIINLNLVHYGSDMAVAAAGIFTTYTSLLVMVVIGICQGMQPIVGYNFGAGLYGRLQRTLWLTIGCSSALVTVGCLFGILCPRLIARAFTTDQELISLTARAFSIAMLAFWQVGFQVVATNFFQSIGYAGKSIIMSLCRQVIFLIPLLYILPPILGLDGIWASFPISDSLATLVAVILLAWQLKMIGRMHQSPSA